MKAKFILTVTLWCAAGFDGKTTIDLLHHGGRERNPIFGANPSTGKVVGLGSLIVAGETVMLWKAKGRLGKVVRVLIAAQSGGHVVSGIRNTQIH